MNWNVQLLPILIILDDLTLENFPLPPQDSSAFTFRSCLPSGWTVLLVSGVTTLISEKIFLNRENFWPTFLVHLSIGFTCFCTSSVIMWVSSGVTFAVTSGKWILDVHSDCLFYIIFSFVFYYFLYVKFTSNFTCWFSIVIIGKGLSSTKLSNFAITGTEERPTAPRDFRDGTYFFWYCSSHWLHTRDFDSFLFLIFEWSFLFGYIINKWGLVMQPKY